jgi:hypothetical protein
VTVLSCSHLGFEKEVFAILVTLFDVNRDAFVVSKDEEEGSEEMND